MLKTRGELLKDLIRRMKEKSTPDEDGCLIWDGGVNLSGRPVLSVAARLTSPRTAYVALTHPELAEGAVGRSATELKPGLHVITACGKAKCVKFEHIKIAESGQEYEEWLDAARLRRGERRRPKKLAPAVLDELRALAKAAACGELSPDEVQAAVERLRGEDLAARNDLPNAEVVALRQKAARAVREGRTTKSVVDDAVKRYGLAPSTVYQILRHDHYKEAGGPYIAGKGNSRIVLESAPG